MGCFIYFNSFYDLVGVESAWQIHTVFICISIFGDKWVNGRTWYRYYIYLSLSHDPTVIKAQVEGFLDQANIQKYKMSERKR